MAVTSSPAPTTVVSVLLVLAAVGVGLWVYRDASRRGHELAPLVAFVVGGLLLAGSVPGLVALAVEAEPATQGFPTAIRVVPGVIALLVYLRLR